MAHRSPPTDPLMPLKHYIAELEDVARASKEGAAIELARYYVQIRDFYDKLTDIIKPLTELKTRLSQQDIPQAFEREGATSFITREGYRVTVSQMIRASTRDMDKGIAWCKTCECGHLRDDHNDKDFLCLGSKRCSCTVFNAPHAGLVKETINAQTLSAFARDEMEAGRELPDDVFNVFIGQNTSITKVK